MFSLILVLSSWWVEVWDFTFITITLYFYELLLFLLAKIFLDFDSVIYLYSPSLSLFLYLYFFMFLLFVNLVIMLLSTLSVIINKDPVKTDLRQERKCIGSQDQKVQHRFRYTWLQVNKQLPSEGSPSAYLRALFSSVRAWTSDPVILEKDLDLSFIALCLK